MSRILSDSMINRSSDSFLPIRTMNTSLTDRSGHSETSSRDKISITASRTPKAIPASGVTVQYVDRYIYVDGTMTTATVFEKYFSWGDVGIQEIFSLTSGAVIAEVNVWMLETYDGANPTLTIGKDGMTGDLMSQSEADPTLLSSFSTRPGKEYLSGEGVNLYMSPGAGATKGRGVISIYII
jgi:hypothetical protein